MSDRELSQLLDRAVHHAPPMHLEGQELLAAGRGRVRRRRALGASGALGAAALVTAVWTGLPGGDGSLTGLPEVQPATTVFEQGEVVDATLFDGFRTIDDDQVDHTFTARLVRAATGPLTLEVSDHGTVVERIPAESPVPGLEVFTGETMTVALWRETEGVVTSVPLVGPVDPGGPTGRDGTEIGGERFGYAVYAAGVDGVLVPQEVVDVHLVGRDDVVALSGTEVEAAVLEVDGARAVAWSDDAAGVWGYAVDGQPAVIEQLGGRPTAFSSYTHVEEDAYTSVTVLPQGVAEGIDVVARGSVSDAEWDGAVLDGRTVVLATGTMTDDEVANDLQPIFPLDDVEFTLADYGEDLWTLHAPDGGQLPSRFTDDGTLTVEDRSGDPVLTVRPDEHLDPLTAWPAEDGTVVAAVGWAPDSTVLTSARVGLLGEDEDEDAGLTWVEAADVAQVDARDPHLRAPSGPEPAVQAGTVTLLSLDVPEGMRVVSVGLARGDEIERWEPPVRAAEVEWRHVDDVPVPFVDGQPLSPAEDGPVGPVRHYVPADGSGLGYVVLPDVGAGRTFVPLVVDDSDELRPAPEIVQQVDQVEVDGGQHTVLTVVGGIGHDGRSSIVAVAGQPDDVEDAAISWRVQGNPTSAHVEAAPGAVVTLGVEQGVWLLHPPGSVDPAELRAGRVGEDVVRFSPDGARGQVTTMVAVHRQGEPAPRVGTEGQQEPTQTHDVDEHGVTVRVWTVEEPAG